MTSVFGCISISDEQLATLERFARKDGVHVWDIGKVAIVEYIERRLSGAPVAAPGSPMGAVTYPTMEE